MSTTRFWWIRKRLPWLVLDRLKIGHRAEQITLAAVAMGQLSVTCREAAESAKQFARAWRKLNGNLRIGPWPGD